MKTSTEIASLSRIVGEPKAIEMLARAGFDAWDFSLFSMCQYSRSEGKLVVYDHPLSKPNYLSYVRELKNIGESCGIHCNQSHAPFPTGSRDMRPYLLRAIECTAEAGGKICVIHPDNDASPEQNAEMYLELLPFAKSCGVKIATENMWNWDFDKKHSSFAACATPDSFNAHLDAVNDDYLVACLDIGHAEMKGSDTTAVEMIHALGPRLQALHFHDNNLVNDFHQIPFSMDIDFLPIMKALKEIGYNGYITLESNSFLENFDSTNAAEGAATLSAAARKLGSMMK